MQKYGLYVILFIVRYIQAYFLLTRNINKGEKYGDNIKS